MILDTIANASVYEGLHAGIDMALKAVASYTPENYETGKVELRWMPDYTTFGTLEHRYGDEE